MRERTNRRGHFRLRYPPGAGPLFVVGGAALRVVELSERGMQFCGDAPPGDDVAGALRFADGTEVAVAGVSLRAARGQVTVRLTRGVRLGRMLAEQRRILRAFPGFLQAGDAGLR